MTDVLTTRCPLCGELIDIEAGFVGKEVECLQCGEVFRIASLEPLQLVYAFDVEDEGEFVDEDFRR